MMSILQGHAWRVDADVAATDILPARYDKLGMKRNWAECATHLLEDLAPDLASSVQPGDILLVAGDLGSGHAHYFGAAVMSCRQLEVGAVLARSINGMFFRSATDLGLTTWAFPHLIDRVRSGDELRVDLAGGLAQNLTLGEDIALSPVPPLILDVFAAGGTANWAMNRPDVRERARRYAEGRQQVDPAASVANGASDPLAQG